MKEPGIELLERYFEQTASPDEVNTIETWMLENRIDAAELKLLVTFPESLRHMFSVDQEKDWQKLRQKLPLRKSFTPAALVFKIAATITLAIAVSALLYLTIVSGNKITTIVNDGKLVKKVTLPDSSFAYLNTGAQLTYHHDLPEERTVSMKGEVFFEIKRDATHPFTVDVQHCQVKVLGTTFNILEDSSQVEVTVATGKISLQSIHNDVVYLEKDERARYISSAGKLYKEVSRNRNYLAWKTGILEFSDTPLNEVAADLAKYFHVKVSISETGKELPAYTSYFEKPQLNDILEEMKLTLPVQYTIHGQKVNITIKD